jgi:hypothetical protein
MKSRIHVNQHIIKRNSKTGESDPVITVKQGKTNTYGHSVQILGPSTVIYSPDKPLSCGAKVWIETESEVIIDATQPGT